MAALGPFEPNPRLAAAVSGGADSMALAMLAGAWARERGGSLLAVIIDHRLRPESAEEARLTQGRLIAAGIGARVISLRHLDPGPALPSRARAARYAALESACLREGILHLLLGHHAADQAETWLMRALSGTGPAGYAGMAALREKTWVRLLRPLLSIPPARLRATLRERQVAWVEDRSNSDPRWLRARLRPAAEAAAPALVAAARCAGEARAMAEHRIGGEAARQVSVRAEGYALLTPDRVSCGALSALIQTISGAPFAPSAAAVARLARGIRPGTVHGVRLLSAGRLGSGWLMVREEAAMANPVPALPGAVWDRRFRLAAGVRFPADWIMGGLGADAAKFRRLSPLPSAVLRTLPCLRAGNLLFSVPHLGYSQHELCAFVPIVFAPPRPLACAPFCPG